MSSRRELANAIRALSMDAVQKANSGHPGMPMGMADIAEVLWNDFLHHNPSNPQWQNRDRFIVSNGHGCMLLYSLLHLTGYDLSIEDIKQFRQYHSKTPGHPELGETQGVETTTGPLGQGLANAVGMAVAQKHLAAIFNKENFPIVDHYIYCFVGDGCLMEGISHEVCSLAGTLGLGKLIVFYDDNGISIDGKVQGWFTDNTPLRFESYGWHVIKDIDGHDSESIRKAILAAQKETDKPTLICCKTQIGFGAPNLAGTAKSHGSALGESEIAATREKLGWTSAPFEIPEKIYAKWNAKEKGQHLEDNWQTLFKKYQSQYPELAEEFIRRMERSLPQHFQSEAKSLIHAAQNKNENIATRKASQISLAHFTQFLPELLGGSADLTESNLTDWKGVEVFSKQNPKGRYIHYGVREFGMSAMMNGMSVYGGIIPFGGTFLTFSDYARNAVRLAAMMRAHVIYVYTHDSIGLGEDGPTHQPIEHAASLRMIPYLSLWRPCDTTETAVAWQKAIEHAGPTCLLLSRQNLPHQARESHAVENIARGGYILFESNPKPDVIYIATGSEVDLAVRAAKQLIEADKINVRVVSMPSTDTFLKQDLEYQECVLPKEIVNRVVIEAGVPEYWYKFAGCHGKVIGIDRFGASAPAKDVFENYGFTVQHVIDVTKKMMHKQTQSTLTEICE